MNKHQIIHRENKELHSNLSDYIKALVFSLHGVFPNSAV